MVNSIEISPFKDAYGYRFRGVGISGTIPFGTTGNVDYKLTEYRKINGVNIMTKGAAWGDTVKFQVVDRDGVYYPAGTVLDEFATAWNIDPYICSQHHEIIEYPAGVLTGLVIRFVYTSVGLIDVQFRCNLYTHKAPT